MQNCMADGDGVIISKINAPFQLSLDSMNTISKNTLKFNDLIPNFSTTNLINPFVVAEVKITAIKNA
jgi:hypothetical protein